MKRSMTQWLLGVFLLLHGGVVASAAQRLRVVATLPTFADLVQTIGGDYVDVASVASPQFNPHFIEPKPSDVLKVKRAGLFVHAGLDLELWRGPLLDAAGNTKLFPGQEGELDLSQGITLLEVPVGTVSRSQGDIHIYGNPHYWVDPENAKVMAHHIAEKLSALDPSHATDYQQHLQEFLARLDQQMVLWHQRLAPYKGQELVGYHNEWPYLMRFAGLSMGQFLEPKPGIPPTPKQVEFLEQYITSHHVRALVQSTYFPMTAAETLSKRTGVKIALLCQNVHEVPQAKDYITMVDYNITQLVSALSS